MVPYTILNKVVHPAGKKTLLRVSSLPVLSQWVLSDFLGHVVLNNAPRSPDPVSNPHILPGDVLGGVRHHSF